MNRNNIFLTENRRDVLTGDSDYSAGALENEKSRIRTLAREAIGELIEVAVSEEIENPSVFEAEQLGALLRCVLNDRAAEGYDPVQGGSFTEVATNAPAELQAYQDSVYTEVGAALAFVRARRLDRGQGAGESDG